MVQRSTLEFWLKMAAKADNHGKLQTWGYGAMGLIYLDYVDFPLIHQTFFCCCLCGDVGLLNRVVRRFSRWKSEEYMSPLFSLHVCTFEEEPRLPGRRRCPTLRAFDPRIPITPTTHS